MDSKQYKRIPVLPDTKKLFDIEKAESNCATQDEFVNELLMYKEIVTSRDDLRIVRLPSYDIAISETNGKILITSGFYNSIWADITDIVNNTSKSTKDETI